jgi:hypothetical protein
VPWLPRFGIKQDFGLADFDVPLVFHFSGVYELPFGKGEAFASVFHGIVNRIVSGWSTNWTLTLQDGQPLDGRLPVDHIHRLRLQAFVVPSQDRYANNGMAHFLNATAFANPPAVTTIGQADIAPLGGSPTQVTGPSVPPSRSLAVQEIPCMDPSRSGSSCCPLSSFPRGRWRSPESPRLQKRWGVF